MPSCEETTRLLSEAQERELTGSEKLALRFHTLMCGHCRRFGKHMDILRQAAQRFAKGEFQHKDQG